MKKKIIKKILLETKTSYNRIADHFDLTRVYPWKVMESFFSYLKSGQRILDVGCGNGRLCEFLKDKLVEYIGIDISEKLIKIARDKFETRNSKSEFLVMDVLDLQFQNEGLDAVFMMAILPHIPSKELQIKALKNIYRVLKKDGYLFITCWNLWQPKIFRQNFKNRFKNPKLYSGLGLKDFMISWKNSQRQILSQRFYHAFTKKELKKILEKAGFKIEKIYYEYKGERSNCLKGFNLVVIAQKV